MDHVLFGVVVGLLMVLMSLVFTPGNAWQAGVMGGLAAVVAYPLARMISRK